MRVSVYRKKSKRVETFTTVISWVTSSGFESSVGTNERKGDKSIGQVDILGVETEL